MFTVLALLSGIASAPPAPTGASLVTASYVFSCKVWTPQDTFYSFGGTVGGGVVVDRNLPADSRPLTERMLAPSFKLAITQKGGPLAEVKSASAYQTMPGVIALMVDTPKAQYVFGLLVPVDGSRASVVVESDNGSRKTSSGPNADKVSEGFGYCDVSLGQHDASKEIVR